MQDSTSPNDHPEQVGLIAGNPELPPDPGLGPAYAVLTAFLGDRLPNGQLGPDNVPATVLDLPLRVATEELVNHAKSCKNLRCPHVPAPLQRYRRMRPDSIRNARAQDEVHKVLWTHPDHELVSWVRKEILEKHPDLAKEVSTGSLLKGDRLREVLNELGADASRVLAAVLWASKFEGPQADALFRALVPLTQEGVSPITKRIVGHEDRQLRSVEVELKRVGRDLKQAKRTAEEAKHDLQVKERALKKSSRDLEEAQRKHRQAAEELDHLQKRFRETYAELQDSKDNAEKATRVNADLRRDLRGLQKAQRDLQVERSELARNLGVERRHVERLKLEKTSVPRGADAVSNFLDAEEDRIRTDQTISSGGAKKRADQEWTVHRKLERAFLDAYPRYREPPPPKIRPKTSLRFVALGGSGEVGRSCYLLELGNHRILVDCGIKPSGSEDVHPAIDHLERIDALILTHAHTDHIGWVPALVRQFHDLDIYCSEGTAALLPVMLDDCRRHYIRNMVNARNLAQYSRNPANVVEEYEQDDVKAVPNLAITCTFREEQRLPFGDISIQFYQAGHILGAASVLIKDQSGRRIFFSGDFSSFPQLTVPAASWPDDLGEIDLLVLESTYGNREHKPLEASRHQLISFIRDTIEGRQGSVILASFALGRAQELLSLIAAARKNGDIPASVPVFVDGMIRQINPIYRKLADLDIPLNDFIEVGGEAERKEIAFNAQTKPAIIVTTSGMLTGGPVVEYARRLLPDSRHRIVLAGYQDEGAPSRALRELAPGGGGPRRVQIPDESGALVAFEAALPAEEVALSSHADQPGLVAYASMMRPKHIALVHGDPSAQEALSHRLLQIHPKCEISCGPSELTVT